MSIEWAPPELLLYHLSVLIKVHSCMLYLWALNSNPCGVTCIEHILHGSFRIRPALYNR